MEIQQTKRAFKWKLIMGGGMNKTAFCCRVLTFFLAALLLSSTSFSASGMSKREQAIHKLKKKLKKELEVAVIGKIPAKGGISFGIPEDTNCDKPPAVITRMSTLTISNTKIKTLAPLKKFTINEVFFRNVKADWKKLDWNGMNGVVSIRFMYCEGLRDFEFLGGLNRLKDVRITTLAAFDSLPLKGGYLYRLEISASKLGNVGFLEHIKGLEHLNIRLNKLSQIKDPSGFKRLGDLGVKGLALGIGTITSIDFLDENMRITSLHIPTVEDLSPLSRLKNIEELSVGRKTYSEKELAELRAKWKTNGEEDIPVDQKLTKEEEEAARIKSEFPVDVNEVVKALATITTSSDAAGTGFVAKDSDGKFYLYTNQHVISGCDSFKARMSDGTVLKMAGMQISASRDIVRFPLAEDAAPGHSLEMTCDATADEPVAVFGNSGGGGVFTAIYGKVLGTGPDRIEVSAKFVPGNSGSPVINKEGKVLGIATYATMKAKKADWTVQGTRFCDVRRFAFKTDKNVKWVPTNWAAYKKINSLIEADKKSLQNVFDAAAEWVRKPYDKISRECKQMDLKIWLANHNKSAAKLAKAKAKGYASDGKMRALNKMAKAQIAKDYKALSGICSRRGAAIRRRLQKYGKNLTPYIRKEMESNAKMFDAMAKEILQYGKELQTKNAFVRPKRPAYYP